MIYMVQVYIITYIIHRYICTGCSEKYIYYYVYIYIVLINIVYVSLILGDY